MKHYLLILFVLSFSINLFSQSDTVNLSVSSAQKELIRDVSNVNVSIYPVPVRENNFTIKSDKEISAIKITNIIEFDKQINDFEVYLVKNTQSVDYVETIKLDKNINPSNIVEKLIELSFQQQ